MVGVVLAGAVHDFIILFASVRSDGKSLAEIAKKEISPVAGFTAAVAILFIVIIALAGLGLAVVNALRESSWGTFTIAATIPIALFMGLYMYRFRKGKIREATIIGVIALIAAVIFGKLIPGSPLGFLVYALEKRNHRLHRDLWSGGFHPSRLDAALPARLPVVLHETGHHRVPHHRRLRCASRPENAGLQPVCGGWRPDNPGQAVSPSYSSRSRAGRSPDFTHW